MLDSKKIKKYLIAYSEIFSGTFKRSFFCRIILKHTKIKKDSRGVRKNAPLKIFKNLHTGTVVAILALYKQFLGKVYVNFLPLILSVSPNMMHFVHTFSIMRA